MAQLAIKGHAIRGNEVIEILEMLGGANKYSHCGESESYFFFIQDGLIDCDEVKYKDDYIIYTLEEFLEKFPYKVGDKVHHIIDNENQIITDLVWDEDEVLYKTTNNFGYVYVNYLQPYKEETMEDKDTIKPTTEINLNHPCFDGRNEIELIIPKGWAFEQRDGKMFGVRKQYPKTYEECCKILNIPSNGNIAYVGNWVYGGEYLEKHLDRLRKFQQLLICRDAYWKLAGEEMGLDKLWKPYIGKASYQKYVIQTVYDNITCLDTWCQTRNILEFPTEEMRDAFHKNFKKLIEACKELL